MFLLFLFHGNKFKTRREELLRVGPPGAGWRRVGTGNTVVGRPERRRRRWGKTERNRALTGD
ncbi:protein of unknown function [Kyrpidia spormannii]|uniref:Uncharacterized protein n=1 Tax=Kyrpidia spormannii TaxID=2055160 RepID=A0A6F9EEE0_9BACL|nr:protein of unknown function [Kyrpidia spormannii]